MTVISAGGRLVFHTPWCPDCFNRIRSRFRAQRQSLSSTDLRTSHAKKQTHYRSLTNPDQTLAQYITHIIRGHS